MPVLNDNLLRLLARRARFTTARLHVMATESIGGRLASLLNFADDCGQPAAEGGGIMIPLRLTQSDLACLVGASRQHTNLTLADFKARRLISFDNEHRITIHDRAALARCR